MPIRTKGTKAPNWSKEEDEILLEMMANQADYMKFMEGQNYSQLDIYRALSMEFHKRSGVMRAPRALQTRHYILEKQSANKVKAALQPAAPDANGDLQILKRQVHAMQKVMETQYAMLKYVKETVVELLKEWKSGR